MATTKKAPTAVKKTTTTKKASTSAKTATTKAKSSTPKKTVAKVTTTKKLAVKATPVKKATTTKTPSKKDELAKVQRDELIENILKKKSNSTPEGLSFKLQEYETPKEFVVVVDCDGNIYPEPVPKYCNFDTFKRFLATFPDVPEDKSFFTFKSEVFITSFANGEIVTSSYDGTRKRNNFYEKFPEIQNGTKIVGGNLIFTGNDKPLNKTEATKMMKTIVERLNTEEITEFNDDDN